MTDVPKPRPARQEDASHLAILADTATGALSTCLWRMSAAPGQSAVGLGRHLIRDTPGAPVHFSNWTVVEHKGTVAGGLLGFPLGAKEAGAAHPDAPTFLQPLTELKALAVPSWFLSVIAVFEEARGLGYGLALMHAAEESARQAACERISLITNSRNARARDLYAQNGYAETARRPFVPFSGSHTDGEWVLMIKSLQV